MKELLSPFYQNYLQADKPLLHVNETQRGVQLFEGEYFCNYCQYFLNISATFPQYMYLQHMSSTL